MAEDEGFEFSWLCPLVAKWPHLVSLSSDQFSKCTVCTIWYALWKRLKGKNKGKLWERYVPHPPTISSRCIEIRRNFRRIFLYSGVQIISRIIRLISQKQTSQNKPYCKSVTKFRISGRIECPKVVALQQFFGLYFQFQKNPGRYRGISLYYKPCFRALQRHLRPHSSPKMYHRLCLEVNTQYAHN